MKGVMVQEYHRVECGAGAGCVAKCGAKSGTSGVRVPTLPKIGEGLAASVAVGAKSEALGKGGASGEVGTHRM